MRQKLKALHCVSEVNFHYKPLKVLTFIYKLSAEARGNMLKEGKNCTNVSRRSKCLSFLFADGLSARKSEVNGI